MSNHFNSITHLLHYTYHQDLPGFENYPTSPSGLSTGNPTGDSSMEFQVSRQVHDHLNWLKCSCHFKSIGTQRICSRKSNKSRTGIWSPEVSPQPPSGTTYIHLYLLHRSGPPTVAHWPNRCTKDTWEDPLSCFRYLPPLKPKRASSNIRLICGRLGHSKSLCSYGN